MAVLSWLDVMSKKGVSFGLWFLYGAVTVDVIKTAKTVLCMITVL